MDYEPNDAYDYETMRLCDILPKADDAPYQPTIEDLICMLEAS